MSQRAIKWAWDQEVTSSGTQIVLLRLAEQADDAGGTTGHVDLESVARFCRLPVSDVMFHLLWLVESGIIIEQVDGYYLNGL